MKRVLRGGESLIVIGILFLFFMSIMAGVGFGAKRTVLTAQRTNESIVLDGAADEGSWADAPSLVIMVQDGSIGNVDVDLKALYDHEYIYFLATWPDPTRSVRKKLWTYNGSGWQASGDEDRLAIFWNIDDSVTGFNIGGCALLCHGDRMHANEPGEKADSWHWKASRTDPVGYADDKVVNSTVIDYSGPLGISRDVTGRHPDTRESGGYYRNKRPDGNDPRYYEPDPADDEDALFLLQSEIESGEAVEIPSETTFQTGDTVPGYILERPIGSLGDIDAKGRWEQGVWTLELKRKLNTGHDDDVQFDTARTYRFGLAVMDNSGGFESYGEGHSFDLGARTLEFGGLGSEVVTQLTLVKDYLLTSQKYLEKGDPGLAISTITDARAIYSSIRNEVSDADPTLHLAITNKFEAARRNPTQALLEGITRDIDLAMLTFQGIREPTKPTLGLRILSVWGNIQLYVFILLSIFVLYPLYKTAQTTRTVELRRLGMFLFLVILPVFFEGLGRAGILLDIRFLQTFSFTTNEYATLLWAIGMFVALIIARFGFYDVEKTLKSLRDQREQLIRSEKKYRTIFDSTLDGVYQTDAEGVFTLINPAGARLFGHTSQEELVGRSSIDYWKDPREREQFMKELKAKKFLKSYPISAKTVSGEETFLEATSRVLEDDNGGFIGVEGILRDVTLQKRAQYELEKYSTDLENSNRLKDIFTDIMRHDLLNPVGLISSYVDLLHDEPLDSQAKEFVETIEENINRATEMIEGASRLARLEKEEDLEVNPVSLGDLVKRAVKDFTPKAEAKNISITTHLKGDYIVRGNSVLYDVFANLIANAIKYSPEGTKIEVGIEARDGAWAVYVKDQGEGVPDEYKEDIFDRFKRIHKGGVEGTGLGLTIVKKIVEIHHGSVWVEDNPEGGSIFYVTIPKDIKGKEDQSDLK